jgi:N utilization substance protein B
VQALYQAEMTGAIADDVIRDFLDHDIGAKAPVHTNDVDEPEVWESLMAPDAILFAATVRGALERRNDLDHLIAGALSGDWNVERLEAVLRAILRAALFEIIGSSEVPAKVVIAEYVDIARAFYSGPEPGLVNAVLDRVAHVIRPGEFGGDGRA